MQAIVMDKPIFGLYPLAGHRAETALRQQPELLKLETPIHVNDEAYLIRTHHLVPYFPPALAGHEMIQRERLNLELCDRVFRISDARSVARDPSEADQAIESLKQQFADLVKNPQMVEKNRGVGRVLFGRITARIRDLSHDYLETGGRSLLMQIQSHYTYIMVDYPQIFSCVRLYDGSRDDDGIIEEIFSEIGKSQIQPLEVIHASRVAKIGAAMEGMHRVAYRMEQFLYQQPSIPSGLFHEMLELYVAQAARLVGFPATAALIYDDAAAQYISLHDEMCAALIPMREQVKSFEYATAIMAWLAQGIALIHSMQHIRDVRKNSIAAFEAAEPR